MDNMTQVQTFTVQAGKELLVMQVIDTKKVNLPLNRYLSTFLAITAAAILTVNVVLIRIIRKFSSTFVNLLVVVDCLISLGHLLILIQYIFRVSEVEVLCLLEAGYNTFMTTSNRCIPSAIAIYRYCCVFYSTWLLSAYNRRTLERIILIFVAGEDRERKRDV